MGVEKENEVAEEQTAPSIGWTVKPKPRTRKALEVQNKPDTKEVLEQLASSLSQEELLALLNEVTKKKEEVGAVGGQVEEKELEKALEALTEPESKKVEENPKKEEMEEKISKKYIQGFKASVHKTVEKDIKPMLQQSKENMQASKATLEKVELVLKKFEDQKTTRDEEFEKMKKQLKVLLEHVVKVSVVKTWVVPDFVDILKEGGDVRVDSEAFFTSTNNGYKLKASLFPHGIGQGSGSHLSVCWHLVPSAKDNFLEWPFKMAVKFKLVPPPSKPPGLPLMAATGIKATKLAFQRPTEENPTNPDRFEGIEMFVEQGELLKGYLWPNGSIVLEVSAWPLEDF